MFSWMINLCLVGSEDNFLTVGETIQALVDALVDQLEEGCPSGILGGVGTCLVHCFFFQVCQGGLSLIKDVPLQEADGILHGMKKGLGSPLAVLLGQACILMSG